MRTLRADRHMESVECVTVHVPLIQSTEGSELATAAALEYFEGRQSDIDSAMIGKIVLRFLIFNCDVMQGKESRHGCDGDGQESLGASDGRRPGRLLVGYIWVIENSPEIRSDETPSHRFQCCIECRCLVPQLQYL